MDLRHANIDTDDYRLIASLHCNYINKGFLSSLGIPFLSVLYEAIDNDDNSFLLLEKIEELTLYMIQQQEVLEQQQQTLIEQQKAIEDDIYNTNATYQDTDANEDVNQAEDENEDEDGDIECSYRCCW